MLTNLHALAVRTHVLTQTVDYSWVNEIEQFYVRDETIRQARANDERPGAKFGREAGSLDNGEERVRSS